MARSDTNPFRYGREADILVDRAESSAIFNAVRRRNPPVLRTVWSRQYICRRRNASWMRSSALVRGGLSAGRSRGANRKTRPEYKRLHTGAAERAGETARQGRGKHRAAHLPRLAAGRHTRRVRTGVGRALSPFAAPLEQKRCARLRSLS
jgi:hypothetical protein